VCSSEARETDDPLDPREIVDTTDLPRYSAKDTGLE
jgi:hypothetical protein